MIYNLKENELSYQTSTVLSGIQAAKDGVEYGFSPNIFDLQSKYFITATIVNIPNKDFDEGLLMKPYWVTKDGTKVYGVERYARVEDSYLHIVNVPVRLVSDNVQATSGTVTVTYDNANLKFEQTYTGTIKDNEPTTTPGFVAGGAFMVEAAAGTEGTVTVTGSADTIQSTDGMFAHLRFKALDANGVLPKTNIFKVAAAFTDAEEADVTGVAAVKSVYHYYNTTYTGNADEEWFDGEHVAEGTTEFVITSPDELYGLAKLVNDGKFTTQKVYLGADITVNGKVLDNEGALVTNTSNLKSWTPIGQSSGWANEGNQFIGSFDGQNHTVRGLYTDKSSSTTNSHTDWYVGLFGTVRTNYEIKNIKVVDSFFKCKNYAGGVVGRINNGKIDNVYSEANVWTTESGAGGIVGCIVGKGTISVNNAWFKGKATTNGQFCGGIVGASGVSGNSTATVTISNCLNEGSVIGGSKLGGLVGRAVDVETFIKDCLNIGTVNGTAAGSVVGDSSAKPCRIEDVYALTSGAVVGNGSLTGEAVATFTNANKNTYYGYKALDVLRDKWDFDNTWVVRANNTPVLKAWCESGALYTPATTWAGGTGTEKDPYIIKTASQLYKLANDVNNGEPYDNTFFKLGANITVNSGTASAWETNAPKYNWITIGKQNNQHFKGSLDGANYTIKGLYIVDTSTAVGLFVDPDEVVLENLKVTNSYLKGGTGTAAVVGWYGGGTFNSIYSDAIVVSTGAHGAGLVSLVDQAKTTFTNCWFDGSLTTGDYSGGIVSCNAQDITLTNCLNTGSVTSSGTTGQVGGMIGRVAATVVMSDCLNTGTISGLKHTASIIGFNHYVSIQVERVFALESSHELTCSNDDKVKAKITKVADVTGANGYLNTYLTFDRPELPVPTTGEWVARKNNVPALKSLVSASDILPLDGNNMYRADTRWYDKNPSATTYTIKTAEELVGLAKLVNEKSISFSGKVVCLGADITVNAETMNASTNKADVYQWTPIGTKGKKFAGTFDGKGVTISGLYSDISNATDDNNKNYWYAGLFGTVNTTASIKDFSIKNSYFKATHYAGSVVGLLEAGTVENIYSEAIIETRLTGAGGIVGQINSSSACIIQNDWFKGNVKAGSLVGGGIVGTVGGSQSIYIKNCMNEGPVSGEQWIGGLAGNITAATNITECINIGTVTGTKESGAAIGRNVSTCVAENVYAVGTLKAVGAGTAIAAISVHANQSDLVGVNGYLNTYLTFDRPELPVSTTGAWVVRKNAVPGLKSFVSAEDILALEGSNMYRVDKRWLNEAGSETIGDVTYATYTIDTAEEFVGFSNHVTAGNDFSKSIVYLGKDIALNKGTVDEWEANNFAGLYTWSPIGTQASGEKFAGIFDGQGYTISGIYTNELNGSGLFGQIADGSKVTDFSLVNSCIVGRQGVGAICGWYGGGTFDTIYTNAKIIGNFDKTSNNNGHYGGFVGLVNANTKFQKCWFDGEMEIAGQYVGGIAGTIPNTGVQMTDCLNTGKMSCTFTGTDYQVGGLAGRVTQVLTITNSLVACDEKIDVKATAEKVGSVLGYVGAAGTNTNVYALEKVYGSVAIGNGTTAAPTICDDLNNYKGYMNTNLDFDNTWVAMENSAPVLQYFAPEEGKFDTTSWYVKAGDGVGTSEENPYLLDSVADMYGFAKRANASTNGFAGKYFKLTSTVTFNEGNPTDGEWATTAPYYVWYPIGSNPNTFKGHFDGGMNTISGLYATRSYGTKNQTWYAGLFGYVTGATIKNVKVVDSYFSAEYAAAPIVGWMTGGEINNVYTNSITKTTAGYSGGIAGCLEGGTIQNVWFQGTVSGKDFAGGIVGVNTTTQGYIKHALSDGTVSINGGQAGGIIGRVNDALKVQDSLSMSTVTAANTNRGAIAGYVTKTGNLNMTSAYGYCKANVTNGATAATAGTDLGAVIGGTAEVFTAIDQAYDTALAGKLDVTKWTFRVGNYPIPTTFAEGVVTSSDYSVAAAKDAAYVIDTDLFGSGTESDPYLITSAAELYGFAVRSQKDNFVGKTIELANNITINAEDTSKENVIFYEWMPIGDKSKNDNNEYDKAFAGTFVGNGYTISGLYRTYKTWESSWIGLFEMTGQTSKISDFNIKNTYFAYTGTSDATRIGSVAGEGYGTFDSIYSDATLKSGGVGVGGILGVVVDAGNEANITNCWFNGKIIGTRPVDNPDTKECESDSHLGGMIGFVYNGGVANVTHSLYSGSIQANLGRKIGGVVGYVKTGGTLTVTDCLITGGISGEQQVGIVAGRVKSATDATSTLRINATWGVNDVVSLDVGSTENAVIKGKTHISTAKDRFIGFIPDVDSTETLASQKADDEETGFTGWVMMKEGTPVLKSFVKEGGIKTPADVYECATVVSALNPNSSYTSWFENMPEYEGNGNYMYTITGQSADDYEAYCDALTSAFHLHSSNTIENVQNHVFTAKNDDLVVDVTYVPTDGTNTIYITVSTGKILSEHLTGSVNYSAKENAVTDDYTLTGDNQLPNVTFHMVEQVEHLNGSGSSYIIQLKNGHLIVIDGGVFGQTPYLFDYMKSLVKEDGKKPVIDAWIVSHCHRDHIGVFQTIWEDAYKTGEEYKDYAGQVYVNGIYFNEPSDALLSRYDYGDREYIGYMKRATALFKTSTNGTPDFYRMQTGQRYTFDDVTMDILLSQELLSIADYDATFNPDNCGQADAVNDTSTWCMFTIGTGNNAKKLLTAGDASYSGKNYMCDMYSKNYLTMDVMTALHHGFNTNLSKFSSMTIFDSGSTLQEEFSQHITVESVVLYSYKYNMTEQNTTMVNGAHAVNWKYAKLNSSFIEHLASKSSSFNNGISVLQDDNTTNRNYLFAGQGTSVLTFGDTITAELKAKISQDGNE